MTLAIKKGFTMKNVVIKGNKSGFFLGLLVLFCSLLTSCDSARENDDNSLLYWSANDAQ